MNEMVRSIKGQLVVSTFDIYRKMGYSEHRKLKEVINDNILAFHDIGLLPLERTKPGKKGGRPIEAYLLNEDHFILLVLLAKNSPESVALKIRVSKEFRRLKKTVAMLAGQRESSEWQKVRKDGKLPYMQKTEVIKTFVDYATEQGSKSAKKYYMVFATMENKSLFECSQKIKNMREVLNIRQLFQVATADQIIEKALQDGMESGMHYKDIFQSAKLRVIEFAQMIGVSQVLQLSNEG